MPFTKSDFEAVSALVKAGKIEQAKAKLIAAKDPRADVMLAKILEKYPDSPAVSSPSQKRSTASAPAANPSSDALTQVKSLIAQKRYDEAEELLWSINDPEADVLLRKLKAVQSAQPASSPAVPTTAPVSGFQLKPKAKETPRSTASSMARAVLVVLTVSLCGIAALMIANFQQQQAEINNEMSMKYALNRVCFEVFWEDYFDQLGAARFNDACDEEIESMVTLYRATVERCYREWKDETYKLLVCLADGGAKFPTVYMLNG